MKIIKCRTAHTPPFASLKTHRLTFAVLMAMAAMPGVQAQPAAPDPELEEVTVTGSRIRTTSGMETPNPVTVVTAEQISLIAPGSLIDGLAELPQFSGSNTTANPGSFFNDPTTGSLSLRGLQGKRTLTLLNGRRVVSSTMNSGPDINLFPEGMLRSVETVTGGASAAYGTDAVSGAVNFILDTNFTGYKGSVQMGENYNGDNQNYEVSFSGGWALDEKSHLLLSVEKYEQDAVNGREDYDWYEGNGLLTNPSPTAGQTPENPLRLPYANVVSRNSSYDGVILFPTTPAAQNQGVWNLDGNGAATPFVLGSASDANFHSIANGGSGTDNNSDQAQIQPETGRQSFFGYIDRDLTESLNVFGQAIYGELDTVSVGNPGLFGPGRSFTIFSGNPYLPANIQALMTANNVPSVTLGRIGHSSDIEQFAQNTTSSDMLSLTAGFRLDIDTDGFFNGWVVDGYAQKGELESTNSQDGGIRIDRIYLAADAVRDPSGNVVCNVTRVSGQYADCKPINLFGRGKASAAAVDWVTGFDPGLNVSTQGWLPKGESIPYSYTGGTDKRRILEMDQDVVELAANGEIWEGFGAGPVSMALGYAWRDESFIQYVQAPQGNVTTNPDGRPVAANNAALGIRGVPGGAAASGNSVEFQFSKVGFGIGGFMVREAFTEFNVPLLADLPFINQLTANLAARWANYSGSGDVWSWKGGLDWRINEELRIRGTVSQDVRAATLGERFDRTGGVANVIDYLEDPNGATTSNYSVTTVSGGNPSVRPEEAKTSTIGIVYQPQWLDGFQASLDWYNVDVSDNINLIGSMNIVQNCYQRGDVDACALIERDGAASTINPGLKRISIVNDVYVNVNSVEAQGIDFELSYRTDIDLFGGGETVGLRLLGNKLDYRTNRNSVGLVTHLEGQFTLPEWNLMLAGNYARGPFTASLQARYEEGTVQSNINNIFQTTLNRVRYDILNNDIASSTIVDGRVGYSFDAWNASMNVYLTVNNLLNKDPVPMITAPDAGLTQATGNGVYGSLLGRRYTLGVNFDF
jgi:iron complex outermembrane receptor protein